MQGSRWPGDIFGKETAYQVYGLGLDFDEGVLAAIHKRKIREHHPDAGGDREQFERYQKAYEILCDPSTRRAEKELERARLRQAFWTSPATSNSSYTNTDASAGHAPSYTTSSNTRVRPRDWGHEGTEAFLKLKVGSAIVAALAVVGLSIVALQLVATALIAAVQFMLEIPPIVPLGLVGVAVTILTLIFVSKKIR
jgi:hypothetical protein